jgi:hypothetical protein
MQSAEHAGSSGHAAIVGRMVARARAELGEVVGDDSDAWGPRFSGGASARVSARGPTRKRVTTGRAREHQRERGPRVSVLGYVGRNGVIRPRWGFHFIFIIFFLSSFLFPSNYHFNSTLNSKFVAISSSNLYVLFL